MMVEVVMVVMAVAVVKMMVMVMIVMVMVITAALHKQSSTSFCQEEAVPLSLY